MVCLLYRIIFHINIVYFWHINHSTVLFEYQLEVPFTGSLSRYARYRKNTGELLFSGTILENLRWGREDATEEECAEACRLACADEFIERFPDGYNTWIEQGGNNVSGGQKQRLCIARALLKNPKVLILDDSTSAVDTATDARIREAFAKKIPGTTKLIVAQRISSVQEADRILALDNGRVNGFDTHENLLRTNPIYREIYEAQTQNGGDFDQPVPDGKEGDLA